MPELANPRWERFCQLFVLLGNASKAYRQAGYSKKSCDANAAILRVNQSIERRINELRAKELFKRRLNREELEGYFASVVTTPIGEITAQHPLAQALEVSDKGTKIRAPDKNTAAQALARMNGWEAAQRVELSASNPLTAYLRELRAKAVQVVDNQ